MKKTLLATALATAALTAGCGDDDEPKTVTTATTATATTKTTATTAEKGSKALTELGETRRLVDEGVAAYAKGENADATELVTDAYLEHFELVEGDLSAADNELNEMLEHQIREELRGMISAGAPVAEVKALHAKIEAGLDKARKKLEAAL